MMTSYRSAIFTFLLTFTRNIYFALLRDILQNPLIMIIESIIYFLNVIRKLLKILREIWIVKQIGIGSRQHPETSNNQIHKFDPVLKLILANDSQNEITALARGPKSH